MLKKIGTYQDIDIMYNAHDEMVNLNQMWNAAGKPKNKDPRKWIYTQGGKDVVHSIAKDLNVISNDIMKSQRGKYGGTWAHRRIALAYGAYLNPDLHALILRWAEERVEEEANPELGIERSRQRAMDAWKRQGHDDKWIAARLKTMDERNSFTDTLQAHGVEGKGYADCTNAIYKGIVDKTGSEIKAQRGIQKGSPARDGLELHELISVEFAEMLSEKRIEDNNAQGNGECKRECGTASRSVRALLDNTTG